MTARVCETYDWCVPSGGRCDGWHTGAPFDVLATADLSVPRKQRLARTRDAVWC